MRRLLVVLSLLFALPAEAATHAYALVVGVNTSVDKGVTPLRYADDDAAKYVRLLEGLAEDTTLLSVFDAETRNTYPDVARMARIPDRQNLEAAVSAIGRKVKLDHARGDKAVIYFVYTGHGARDPSGEGYVNLVDEKFTRTDLHRLLLSRPRGDDWERPDALHVIVDACSAYFLVHDRGAGLSASNADYSGHMGELFGAGATPEKYPHAGFLLATTGDVKVHEWSAYRSGVFSHLVRSALSGAADVDLDGRVTYGEMGAFIAAASGSIKDPRARISVTVTPPPADAEAALSEWSRFSPKQLVVLDPSLEGHFNVESEDGERLVDLNKPAGLRSVFAVWGAKRFYLEGDKGESVLDFSKKTVIASRELEFGEVRKATRGAIDEEFRRALFSKPFDLSYYEAYCSLMRLPVSEGMKQHALPADMGAGGGTADVGISNRPEEPRREPSKVRPRTIVALGGAGGLGLASAILLSVGSNARADARLAQASGKIDASAESSAQTFTALGAGAAVGAGASLLLGAGLLALDLTAPTPTLTVSSGGAAVGLATAF